MITKMGFKIEVVVKDWDIPMTNMNCMLFYNNYVKHGMKSEKTCQDE